MPTHAHYAGEFGSQEMTKKLEKDPAYRGARAEHFAREAEKASEAHRIATTHADRAAHALVVAHAMKRSAAHAKAATKMAPGSEHERYAHDAAATAAMHHENVTAREAAGLHATQKTADLVASLGMSGSAKQPHTDMPKSDAALTQLKTGMVKPTLAPLDRKTSDLISRSTQAAHVASEASREANRISDKRGHVAAAEAHRTAEKLFRKLGDTEEADTHAKRAESHDAKAVMSEPTGQRPNLGAPRAQEEHPAHLAEIVHATLPKVPESGRFGDRKVFTHEVYKAMSPAEQAKFGGTVDKFKDKLVELQRSQHVTLSRADLPQAMDAKQVAASHVSLEGGKHEWGGKHEIHANFVTATGPIPVATPKTDEALGKLKSSKSLQEKLSSESPEEKYQKGLKAGIASEFALHASKNATTTEEHYDAARGHSDAKSKNLAAGNQEAAEAHGAAESAHMDAAKIGRRIKNGEGLKNFSLGTKHDEYSERARKLAHKAHEAVLSHRETK